MDKKNIKLVTFFLIILAAITCTDDEIPTRGFPGVKTLEVTNITNLGAQFNAEILRQGNGEIIEYGFAWGQGENPTIEFNEKRAIAEKITTGTFTAQIETTLKDGKKYYARAYAKSDEYLVYGMNVPFISLGSGAAAIDDFYPKLGTWGDTITLKGKNFSYLIDHNHVYFKDIESSVINSTDSTIVCIVPEDISEKSVPISVKIADQLSQSKENFEFIVPEIESFYPMKAKFGDTIKLVCNNFDPIINKINFSGHQAEVIDFTETSVDVIVPISLDAVFNTIEISLRSISNPAKDLFELLVPRIESFSPIKGTFGDSIKLFGENFDPITNKIDFNGYPAEVIEFTETSLTVIVPTPLDEKFSTIGITLRSISNSAKDLFELMAPRIDEISPESGYSNTLIKIIGDNFNPETWNNTVFFDDNLGELDVEVIEAGRNELTVKVPRYIYTDRSIQVGVEVAGQKTFSASMFGLLDPWLRRKDAPSRGYVKWRATGFSLLNKGYVGLGYGNSPYPWDDFYRFDPIQNTWETIAVFAGGPRYDAADFVIDNIAYVGSGSIDQFTWTGTSDFWRFDPQTDTWTEIASLPIGATNAVGLSANGKGYICIPDDSNNFWSYDPSNDEWTQMPDLIIGSMGGLGKVISGFVIDNKIYIYAALNRVNKELYEFDPGTLQWSRKSDLIGSEGLDGEGFSLNSKGYLVIENDFYQYNALTDSWKILNPFLGKGRVNAISFVIDGKAYYGTSGSDNDIWEYDPEYE